MSKAALILSKADSVRQAKRMRDAFDIYLLLSAPESKAVAAKRIELSRSFRQASDQSSLLKAFLIDHPEGFDRNVQAYLPSTDTLPSPSKYVRKTLYT